MINIGIRLKLARKVTQLLFGGGPCPTFRVHQFSEFKYMSHISDNLKTSADNRYDNLESATLCGFGLEKWLFFILKQKNWR